MLHKKYSLLVIYVLSLICLVVLIFATHNHIQEQVKLSYTDDSSFTTDPDTILNHANTYYWFARNKKNTVPEFKKSIELAHRSKLILNQDESIDDEKRRLLNLKADQIIEQSQNWLAVSELNMVSAIPFYAEIMNYDSSYVEDDSDGDLLPIRTVQRGIQKVIQLGSPDDREVAVQFRVAFALVIVPDDEPELEALVVQQLNASTQLYTISHHEIAGILGKNTPISEVASDSISMLLLSEAFNTDEIAIFNIIKNDVVDGIYYYGIRLEIWSAEHASIESKWYTEVMLRDRVFNQMLPLVIPLTLLFLAICTIIGLSIYAWVRWGSKRSHALKLPAYHILLSFVISITGYLLARQFLLIPIINPGIEAMYFDPMAEFWLASFPLTLVLIPSFLSYIILGKLDNWFKGFESNLHTLEGLFSWLSGAFLTIPIVFMYNDILRFGVSNNQWLFVLTSLLMLSQAWFIARYLHSMFDHPWKIALSYRVLLAFIVFAHIILLMVSIYFFSTDYSATMTLNQVVYAYLPVTVLSFVVWNFGNRKFVNPKFEAHRETNPEVKPILPMGFQDSRYKIRLDDSGYIFISGSQILKTALLEGKKGIKTHTIVEDILFESGKHRYYHVDFSQQKPEGDDTHYYPFAFAFKEALSKNRFNDVAEKARRASNVLGRLISNISSFGDVLVDEGGSRARKRDDIAEDIISLLSIEPSVILFSNMERADQESMGLITELLEQYLARLSTEQLYLKPLILLAYNTEFQLKDDLIALSSKYAEVPRADSITIPICYSKPAFEVLSQSRWNLPIQAKISIAEELEKQNKDSSPDIVEFVLEKMEKSGSIRTHKNNEHVFMTIDREAVKDLPEFETGVELQELLAKKDLTSLILQSAAYAANEKGQFPLALLEQMTGQSRLDLLQILGQLEKASIVYDLREEKYYDWFSFTDTRYITEIKETENARNDVISQITREFYRLYLEFYLPYSDWDQNLQRLKHFSPYLGSYDQFVMAQRAMKLNVQDPQRALQMNNYAAHTFSDPKVAQFDYALECVNNVLQCLDGPDNHSFTNQRLSALILKLNILNEKGSSIEESKHVVREIDHLRHLWNSLTKDDKLSMDFAICRFCFTHFDETNKKRGTELCEVILKESKDEISIIRARFYQLKLIPMMDLTFRLGEDLLKTEKLIKITEVRNTYRSLVDEMSDIVSKDVTSILLLGEIINDYAGSFLTDKQLPILVSAWKKSSEDTQAFRQELGTVEELFNEIDDLFLKRLEIAGFKNLPESIKSLDLTHLDTWLFGDAVIDRRGLCYTLNYMNRAFLTIEQYDQSIAIGKLSYKLNRFVRDNRGCSVVSGMIAKAYLELGLKDEQASYDYFKWLERNFGYTWLSGDTYKLSQIAWNMIDESNKNNLLNAKIKIAKAYLHQVELLHLIEHLEIESLNSELLRSIFMDTNTAVNVINQRDCRSVFSLAFASDHLSILDWTKAFYLYFREQNESLAPTGSVQLKTSNWVADVDYQIHEVVIPEDPNSSEKRELKFTLHFNDHNSHLPWFADGVGIDNVVEITSDEMRSKCYGEEILNYDSDERPITDKLVGIVHYKEELDQFQIVTTFPGTYAPKLPKHCKTDSERAISMRFWQDHAFIKKRIPV
jgi:hypothetical protein